MPSPIVVGIVSVLAFAACMGVLLFVSHLQDRRIAEEFANDTGFDTGDGEAQPVVTHSAQPVSHYDEEFDAWIPEPTQPVTLSDLRSYQDEQPRIAPVVVKHAPAGERKVSARNIHLPIGTITGTGREYRVPLSHTIVGRKTGGGKTNILVWMGMDALAQGCEVWFVTPKYMRVDDNDGLDLDDFARRVDRLVIDADFGFSALRALEDAVTIINERVTSSHAGPLQHRPLVLVVDEAKAYNAAWRMLEVQETQKNATKRGKAAIEYILATGRQAEVFLLTSGQDCQAQSLELSRGTQSNFLVKIGHSSLDHHSLINILPRGVSEDALPIPQGRHDWYVVTDNDYGTPEVALVTVPRVNNASIASTIGSIATKRDTVLGNGNEPTPPKADETPKPERVVEVTSQERLALREVISPDVYMLIAYLIGTGASQREIAKRVYNVPDGGGSYSVRIRPLVEAVRRELESRAAVTVTVTDGESGAETPKNTDSQEEQPVTPSEQSQRNGGVTVITSPSDFALTPFVTEALQRKS